MIAGLNMGRKGNGMTKPSQSAADRGEADADSLNYERRPPGVDAQGWIDLPTHRSKDEGAYDLPAKCCICLAEQCGIQKLSFQVRSKYLSSSPIRFVYVPICESCQKTWDKRRDRYTAAGMIVVVFLGLGMFAGAVIFGRTAKNYFFALFLIAGVLSFALMIAALKLPYRSLYPLIIGGVSSHGTTIKVKFRNPIYQQLVLDSLVVAPPIQIPIPLRRASQLDKRSTD